jgi:iron complex outermembrane receptor protein
MWTPESGDAIWGAYTRAVRTPSRAERDFYLSGYLGTGPGGVPFFARFNANREFRTESLNGFEVGYRRLVRPDLFVDIATFYNRYDDLFSQNITGPVFGEATPAPEHLLLPAQFRNSLMGATSGYEIAPEWRPREWWRLRGSWSYLQIDVKARPGSGEVGSSSFVENASPEHQVVVQSALEPWKQVELDLTYRYVSGLGAFGIPAYSTGDARIGWRFWRDLEIAVVANSLLQPWHAEFGNDPGPPVGIRRSIYGRIAWGR